MTMIEPKEVKCPICNTIFEIYLLMSTNSMGSPDLDLRPPEMQRSTMDSWVHECPSCGYASVDFDLKPSVTREFIESESYQSCDGFDFKNPLSKRFYRLSTIVALGNSFGLKVTCSSVTPKEKSRIVTVAAVTLVDRLTGQ